MKSAKKYFFYFLLTIFIASYAGIYAEERNNQSDGLEVIICKAIERVVFKNWLDKNGSNLSVSTSHYAGLISYYSPEIKNNIIISPTLNKSLNITIRLKAHPSNSIDILNLSSEIFYGAYKYGFDHYLDFSLLDPVWKKKPPWNDNLGIYEEIGLKEKPGKIVIEIYNEKSIDQKLYVITLPEYDKIDFSLIEKINIPFFSDKIWLSDYPNNIIEPISFSTYISLINQKALKDNRESDIQLQKFKSMIITEAQLSEIKRSKVLSEQTIENISDLREQSYKMLDGFNSILSERSNMLKQIIAQKEQIEQLLSKNNTAENELSNSKREISNLKISLDEASNRIRNIEETLRIEKQNALQEKERKLSTDFEQKQNALNFEIKKRDASINELKSENAAYIKMLDAANNSKFDLKNELNSKLKTIDQKDAEIIVASNEIRRVKLEAESDRKKEYQKGWNDAKKEIDELKKFYEKKITDLNLNTDSLMKTISEISIQKKDIENKLHDERLSNSMLQAENSSKNTSIKNLMISEQNLKAANIKLEAQNKYLEEKSTAYSNEINALKNSVSSIEDKLRIEQESAKINARLITQYKNDISVKEKVFATELQELKKQNEIDRKKIEDEKAKLIKTYDSSLKELSNKNERSKEELKKIYESAIKERDDSSAINIQYYKREIKKLKEKLSDSNDDSEKSSTNTSLNKKDNEKVIKDSVSKKSVAEEIKTLKNQNQKNELSPVPEQKKPAFSPGTADIQEFIEEYYPVTKNVNDDRKISDNKIEIKNSQSASELFDLYTNLGLRNCEIGNLSESKENFEKCLEFASENPTSYYNLAALLTKMKNYGEAHKVAAAGLKRAPADEGLNQIIKLLNSYGKATIIDNSNKIITSEIFSFSSETEKTDKVEKTAEKPDAVKKPSISVDKNIIKISFSGKSVKIKNQKIIRNKKLFLQSYDVNCPISSEITETLKNNTEIEKINIKKIDRNTSRITFTTKLSKFFFDKIDKNSIYFDSNKK